MKIPFEEKPPPVSHFGGAFFGMLPSDLFERLRQKHP